MTRVLTWNVLGEMVVLRDWSLDDALLFRDFSKIVILELVVDGDVMTGGGVIRYRFLEREDNAEEEVPVKILTFKFFLMKFLNFFKNDSYFNFG